MSEGPFEVDCPCCRARLEIDPGTRTVLSSERAPKNAVPRDLRKAVKQLEEQAGRLESAFQERFEAEKRRGEASEKRFAGLFEKQRKDSEAGKPLLRDIDLD